MSWAIRSSLRFERTQDLHRLSGALAAHVRHRPKTRTHFGPLGLTEQSAPQVVRKMNTTHTCRLAVRHSRNGTANRRRDTAGAATGPTLKSRLKTHGFGAHPDPEGGVHFMGFGLEARHQLISRRRRARFIARRAPLMPRLCRPAANRDGSPSGRRKCRWGSFGRAERAAVRQAQRDRSRSHRALS
jgi:hypothetical protein